jgi:hypothetical protein
MPARRHPEETPSEKREREARIAASIATLERAGLTVEPLDNHRSLVADRFEWHCMTHAWSERGGEAKGYGLSELIKAAKTDRGPDIAAPKQDEGQTPHT